MGHSWAGAFPVRGLVLLDFHDHRSLQPDQSHGATTVVPQASSLFMTSPSRFSVVTSLRIRTDSVVAVQRFLTYPNGLPMRGRWPVHILSQF